MGEIINLRQARKERDRREKERLAAENRAAFGRTKAEKRGTEAGKKLEDSKLDGHKRDPGEN
jgi:hypothetical protein